MSPLDVKSPPILKGEDGEGSLQVKMDQSIKIEGAKVFAVCMERVVLVNPLHLQIYLLHSQN